MVKSSSAPEVVSSSIAEARACICSVLSFARWIARPVSAICSPIPVAASPIRTWASAAEYCALIVSFCVRKASTLAESAFSLAMSFSCCCSSPFVCSSSDCSCCCRPDFRSKRLPSEVLAAGGQRLARLRVELDQALLQLRLLELQPLLGGDDVGDRRA